MGIFRANADFLKKRVLHGVVYFLMLFALAMTRSHPAIILLSAVFLAVIPLAVGACESETGYASRARSVCKNKKASLINYRNAANAA